MTAPAVFFLFPQSFLKLASALPVAGDFFLRKFKQKEGKAMQEFVARLIDCGIPRMTAVCICNHFKKENKLDDLALYVDAVEAECREQLDLL